MGILASTTFQCGFIEKPENLFICVSPTVLLFNSSVSALNKRVQIDVYVGDRRLLASEFTCSALATSTTITKGLVWGQGISGDGGRYYGFNYTAGNDINMNLPFTVTVNGVAYPQTIVVQTVKNGNDGSGSNGKNGVYIPPLMLWDDYPSTYQFQAGVPGTDTRLDMVGIKNGAGQIIPYYCIETHTKSASYKPGTDTTKWRAADAGVYECVATELLLAANARIDFLSGQAIRIGSGTNVCGYFGTPTAGGAILYTGGETETGATFVVFRDGVARWGSATGQKIEINPNTKRLNVYDSSGQLCAIHSGDALDYTKVGSETGSGSSNSVLATSMKKTLTGQTSTTETIASGTAAKEGTLKVTVPGFVLSCVGGLPANDGTTLMSSYKAELYLEILIGGVVAHTSFLAHVDASATGNPSYNQNAVSAHVTVPMGKTYQARLRYVSNMESSGTSTFSPSGNTSISFEVVNKVCHYGSNGWYISASNQNYAYFILDTNGKLHAKIVSGGNVKFNTD